MKHFYLNRGRSDFLLNNSNRSVISARTMDYAIQINAEVVIVPREKDFISLLSSSQPYMKWVSKYGFVAANVLHSFEFTDGLNEKGLSVAILWLGETKYIQSKKCQKDNTITIVDLPSWLLGNFANVDEVIEGD